MGHMGGPHAELASGLWIADSGTGGGAIPGTNDAPARLAGDHNRSIFRERSLRRGTRQAEIELGLPQAFDHVDDDTRHDNTERDRTKFGTNEDVAEFNIVPIGVRADAAIGRHQQLRLARRCARRTVEQQQRAHFSVPEIRSQPRRPVRALMRSSLCHPGNARMSPSSVTSPN